MDGIFNAQYVKRIRVMAAATAFGFSAISTGVLAEGTITDVVVHTTVTPGGQHPDVITVTTENMNLQDMGEIKVSDFSFSGMASGWMTSNLHEFQAEISSVELNEDQIILTFTDFPEKFFYVKSWEVNNAKIAELNFSSKQVSQVITPVADDFTYYSTNDGEEFYYQLYTPQQTEEPLPLVVVFHGYSDTNNLLTYRTSVAWAEPEAQAERPCYVLSPVIGDSVYWEDSARQKVYKALAKKIKTMVSQRLIDPKRIYICGNSFGGMATIEFMEANPDMAAGAIPMCSALNYSQTAMDNLDKIIHIPLWIAQAESDGTIPSENSKKMYQKLIDEGSEVAKLTIYTDEEMNEAGGSSDPDSTYSYHHVELAVMEDDEYARWLFAQSK